MDFSIKQMKYIILFLSILVFVIASIIILFNTGILARAIYPFIGYKPIYIGEFNMTTGVLHVYSVGRDYYVCINKISEQTRCIITENNIICDDNNCIKIIGYIKT